MQRRVIRCLIRADSALSHDQICERIWPQKDVSTAKSYQIMTILHRMMDENNVVHDKHGVESGDLVVVYMLSKQGSESAASTRLAEARQAALGACVMDAHALSRSNLLLTASLTA